VGPAVTISYLLAGLPVLVIMRALSEMAAAQTGLGSFTEYIRTGLGPAAGCSMLTVAVVSVLWVVIRLRRRRQARTFGPVASRECI
jgi:GABA permease